MNNDSRTKIIATLGPATSDRAVLKEMIDEGLDVFRLNFSHGGHDEKAKIIETIRNLEKETGVSVAILGDLQGPKIRIGIIDNEPIYLKTDEIISFTTNPDEQSNANIYISYDELARDIKPGDNLLIDDGKLKLECVETDGENSLKAKVIYGGPLTSKKGVNLPDTKTSVPSLTEKDKKDVHFAIDNNLDWIALSFIRTADDVIYLRDYLKKYFVNVNIIAKVEKPEAVEDIDKIIEVSDGIMVARGDLGVEVNFDKVPVIQKIIVEKCVEKSKPVIIATQMLESMCTNFRPTRAEANDVANAVLDGADALMLSGETSIGKYPVDTIRAMESIIKYTERNRNVYYNHQLPDTDSEEYVPDSICYNACVMAEQTSAKAIISFTYSGYTALRLAAQRPHARIYAFTANEKLLRRLPLLWGLNTFYSNFFDNIDDAIKYSSEILLKAGLVEKGDLVVHVASTPLNLRDRANMIKLSRI
jgi:pyruvate kinase